MSNPIDFRTQTTEDAIIALSETDLEIVANRQDREAVAAKVKDLEEQIKQLGYESFRLNQAREFLANRRNTLNHAAAGKCQCDDYREKYSDGSYASRRSLCPRPAKADGLCGIHRAARVRRGY